MEISVPYIYLLAVILAAFGVIGFKRGWAREGATFGGAFAAWLIMVKLGDGILQLVNRFVRSILFVLQGGIDSDDPARLVHNLNQVQVVDLEHPQIPLTVLFIILVSAVYWLTARLIATSRTMPAKVGGALISIVTGYLITFVILQEPSLRSTLFISLTLPWSASPTNGVPGFMGQYLSGVLVVLVGIVIVFALFSSIRTSRRRLGSGWAEKRKG